MRGNVRKRRVKHCHDPARRILTNHRSSGGNTARCCRVVDLRPYALHAQRADIFATLFEREFIQAQEAAGITVIGQFRNPDDPDRFVWLRGFRDMASRATALQAFYDSALWKPPRDEANANSPTPTTCCCPSRANDAGEFS